MKGINVIADQDKYNKIKLKGCDDGSLSKASQKSSSAESLISHCASSADSDRYDTVVSLQDYKHSDTTALLVRDEKGKKETEFPTKAHKSNA